jgi:preprotein translocase SecE subunit
MANKTIDRKKAVPARSQAAKASPKNAPIKASRPAGNTPAKSATLTPEKSVTDAEVLEADELEIEAPVDEADERDESDEEEPIEDESDEVVEEEEEEEVVEKPAKTRSKGKKDRDLVVSPQDYNVIRPTRHLPNFPGSKFLYSSYRELRLVTWPSRHDVWTWSLVVVIVSVAIAALLGLADFGLSKFVTWWLSLAH